MAEETQLSKPETIRSDSSLEDVTKMWLKLKLHDIEKVTKNDVLTICGGILPGVDIRVRMAIEELVENKQKTLLVILHTDGGYVEEVQNIVKIIRHHYESVHFLVPICAMSAGTVLVMSGDKIYMDYFSRLGPIDPQIQFQNGDMVPGLSYLRQYEKLIEKAKQRMLTTPELCLLNKLDLAQLNKIKLAADLSVSLIEDWLAKYKFKNWEKNGKPVPKDKKKERAKEIAESLNDHEKWYTHGNSLHKDVLEKGDLRLKIDDYSRDKELKKAVWTYFWAVLEYVYGERQRDLIYFVQSRDYIL